MSEILDTPNHESQPDRQMPKFVYMDQLNSSEELRECLENFNSRTLQKGDEYSVSAGNTVLNKNEAQKAYGLNGDILGVIELPSGNHDKKGVQLAIVDYGKNAAEERPPRYAQFEPGKTEGKSLSVLETVRTRYELARLDEAASAPLFEGKSNDFGRKVENPYNANLGIGMGIDDQYVSGNHFSVSIDKNDVFVNDTSTNGTILRAPQPARVIRQK